jgi:alanine dehydrogenase
MTTAAAGFPDFARKDNALARGVNIVDGRITCRPVAEAFGKQQYTPIEKFF